MRSMFLNFAVALLLLSGCRERQTATQEDSGVRIDVVASPDSLDAAWYVSDEIALFENGACSVVTCGQVDDAGRGIFGYEREPIEVEEYRYSAIFPSGAVITADSVNVASQPFVLAEVQYPTTQAPDVMADVCIATEQRYDDEPQQVELAFSRVVARWTINLKNLPEDEFIKEVVVTIMGGKHIAGECVANLVTGDVAYATSKNSSKVTLRYTDPVPTDTPLHLALVPTEFVGGDSFRVEAMCGNNSYSQTVTLDLDERLMLARGAKCETTVEMPEPEPEPQRFVFRRVAKVTSGRSYILAVERRIAEPVYESYGYLSTIAGDTDDDGEIVLTSCDNAFIFEKRSGGYAIKQACNGEYLYQTESYNSFNTSASPTEGDVWRVEPQSDNSFKISNVEVGKFVQYNASHDSFGSYDTKQPGSYLPQLYELDGELVVSKPVVAQRPQVALDLDIPAQRNDGAYPQGFAVNVVVEGERNYTMFYDPQTYTSLWVAYPLAAHHMGSMSRPGSWSYNPYVSTSDQVNLCSRSYNDEYSRGHLIPNASRNGNREMQLQTFYVTNSVPQIQNKFNGGIWQQLESALQGIAQKERIYIVTGVAFEKVGETKSITYTTAKNDSKQVPVPNYFYKVVLKVKTDESGAVVDACSVGFWFEHRTYSDSYDKYAVSVDQIEAWTGFDYFPALTDAIETTAEQNNSWKTFKAW